MGSESSEEQPNASDTNDWKFSKVLGYRLTTDVDRKLMRLIQGKFFADDDGPN